MLYVVSNGHYTMIGTVTCDIWYRSGGSVVEEKLILCCAECRPVGQVYQCTCLGKLTLCV